MRAMTQALALQQSYDGVPYTAQPVPQSHPDRLCVLAHLHGLAAAPVETARILELGCATGGNLLPLAAHLPRAECVGLDLSERQIALARQDAAAAGLDNLRLEAGDVTEPDWPLRLGRFDYIIAHGLYSWVPERVQAVLLDIVARLLAPRGVAYVSYNCHPGWHLRGIVRSLMQQATAGIADPGARCIAARSALERLRENQQGGEAYGAVLAQEAERVAALDDSFLLHDLLEHENRPVWFRDFAAAAGEAGLQWLSESNLSVSRAENRPAGLHLPFGEDGDIVEREQALDFWLNRSLRESLLCGANHRLDRDLVPTALDTLWVSAEGTADPHAAATGETFFQLGSVRVGLRAPAAVAALRVIVQAGPGGLALHDLLAASPAPEEVRQLVFDLAVRNLVELAPRAPDFLADVPERPLLTRLARRQSARGEAVTNFRHRPVLLDDPLAHRLAPLLDGGHDRAGLTAALARDGGAPVPPARLEAMLGAFAMSSLLSA